MAAAFKNVLKASDVRVDVVVRMIDRVTHASLRRKMHDAREAMLGKERTHCGAISDVELYKAKSLLRITSRIKSRKTRQLQPWVVVRIEIIDPEDFFPAIEQSVSDVRADKSSASSDKNHCARV